MGLSSLPADATSIETLVLFPFQPDPKRTEKWLIGALIALVAGFFPVLPYALLLGHGARISRDVQAGRPPTLPEWHDLTTYLIDGFKMIGVGVVYSLPALVLLFGANGVVFGSMAILIVASGGELDRLDSNVFSFSLIGGQLVFFSLIVLGTILMLIGVALAVPAIQHMLATGRFASAFDVRAWWPMLRTNISGWLIAFAVLFGVNLVLGLMINVLLFSLVFCILLPIAGPLFQVFPAWVGAALYADAYRVGRERHSKGIA
jgi:hypothetical protein